MSEIDTMLKRAGSEYREAAARVPEKPLDLRSSKRLSDTMAAIAAGAAVLVLVAPLALWLGVGGEDPKLQAAADVVFEGDNWIFGFREESIPGTDRINFCWEFNAVGRGPGGSDVFESGCDGRRIPTEGVEAHVGSAAVELEDVSIMVYESRPGDGGQIEVQTGRTRVRYDGQRMPLSGADVFVFEAPKDAGLHIRHLPRWKPRGEAELGSITFSKVGKPRSAEDSP